MVMKIVEIVQKIDWMLIGVIFGLLLVSVFGIILPARSIYKRTMSELKDKVYQKEEAKKQEKMLIKLFNKSFEGIALWELEEEEDEIYAFFGKLHDELSKKYTKEIEEFKKNLSQRIKNHNKESDRFWKESAKKALEKAEEVEEKYTGPIEKENITIGLDFEQDVHSAWDKDDYAINFLENHDYTKGWFHSLGKGRQKEYFVKKRHPESALHTYYVDLIYQEIRRYTKWVKKYRTERPDILFRNKKGQEIAIEVETGINVNKKRKYHAEKFGRLRKKYPKRCYIFLVSTRLKHKYTRHGFPLLFRLDIVNFVKSQCKVN